MTYEADIESTVRDVLDLHDDIDLSSIAFGVTPTWDSVAHLQLAITLEERFGVELKGGEVSSMSDMSTIRHVMAGAIRSATVQRAPPTVAGVPEE